MDSKTILIGTMRVLKGTSTVIGVAVMVGATLAIMASTAEAAKTSSLKAGVQNAVKATTSMIGNIAGPVLRLDNDGAGPALDLQVQSGKAPLTVSQGAGTATNLDADKIDGKDSSEFLTPDSKVSDADNLDGKDSTDFQARYARTIVVSPVGTATENGTALRNTLTGIADASADSPYLLKLEPGIYDLGTATLHTRPYVDIEGSGERVTKITASGAAGTDANTITSYWGGDSELRFVTVENTGGGDYATAIRTDWGALKITHVTARASGGTKGSRGIVNASTSPEISHTSVFASGSGGDKTGIHNANASPTITDVDVTVSGSGGENRGIDTNDGVGGFDLLKVQDARISVSGGSSNFGIYNKDTDAEIRDSRIEAEGSASVGIEAREPGVGKYDELRLDSSVIGGVTNTVKSSGGSVVRIGGSRLHGGPTASVSACAGVYDENYTFSASTCP